MHNVKSIIKIIPTLNRIAQNAWDCYALDSHKIFLQNVKKPGM